MDIIIRHRRHLADSTGGGGGKPQRGKIDRGC